MADADDSYRRYTTELGRSGMLLRVYFHSGLNDLLDSVPQKTSSDDNAHGEDLEQDARPGMLQCKLRPLQYYIDHFLYSIQSCNGTHRCHRKAYEGGVST